MDQDPFARLKIARNDGPGTIRLCLDGELDLASAAELDRHLGEIPLTGLSRVLIDLSGVTFMDSSGLASIVGAHHVAKTRGYDLMLRVSEGSQVARLFELTGLTTSWTFED